MAKQKRATDELNVALAGISAAFNFVKGAENLEQAQRAVAIAKESLETAWGAFAEIRKNVERI